MVFPTGTGLTFSGSASATLYADTVTYEFDVQTFERQEFSNSRLRSAPTSTGAQPIIVQSFGNKPIQLAISCTGDSPRPLIPDDANINDIKKQFNIERYTIGGAPTYASDLASIYTVAQAHKKILSKFQLHIEKSSMELSYDALVAMQAETFSYLTASGLDVSGASLPSSLSDILIVDFDIDVTYLLTETGNQVDNWSLTFELRTITDRVS